MRFEVDGRAGLTNKLNNQIRDLHAARARRGRGGGTTARVKGAPHWDKLGEKVSTGPFEAGPDSTHALFGRVFGVETTTAKFVGLEAVGSLELSDSFVAEGC